MRTVVICIVILACLLLTADIVYADPVIERAPTLNYGSNLTGLRDWTPEFVLVDAFKLSRPWLTQNAWQWDTGETNRLNLDADGWVRSLPTNDSQGRFRWVGTVLFTRQGTRYPAGRYIVLYDGQGTIEYGQDAVKNWSLSRPGRDVIDVNPAGSSDGILLRIVATDPYRNGNYIRNIRVLMPGFDETNHQSQTFYPPFLASVEPYSVLRFMDWQRTNYDLHTNEPIRSVEATQAYDAYVHPLDVLTNAELQPTANEPIRWEDRPLLTDAQYTSKRGSPVELMVQLANTVDADPWFNMPHLADNNYVYSFAQLVLQQLEPNRYVYVEYSNEAWNGGFGQTEWMRQQGALLWPGSPRPWHELGLNYYAKRSAEVCGLWKSAWGNLSWRVRCVISGQAADPTLTRAMLACSLWQPWTGCGQYFDVLGIAPYFGQHLGNSAYASYTSRWAWEGAAGLDKLFLELQWGSQLPDTLTPATIDRAVQRVAAHKALADQNGLALVAYEGGQHLLADKDLSNNSTVVDLFARANRDPRMGQLYDTYFNGWKAQGGTLFMHYKNISPYDEFGYWGAQEYLGQMGAPKRAAIERQIAAISCPTGCPPVTPRLFLPIAVRNWRIWSSSGATAP